MKGTTLRTAGGRSHTVLALLILLVGVLMSGCMHAKASLNIAGDDTVSGEFLVSTQTADGQAPFQLRPPEDLADRVHVKPYQDDGRVGSRLTFQRLEFDEVERLASALSPNSARYKIHLHRAGSLVLFDASVDLTPLDETDSSVLIELSAPGEITTTNGDETAGVVSWAPEPGQVSQLSSVSQFTSSGAQDWVWWALFVVLLAFGAAGTTAYLAQRSSELYHYPAEKDEEDKVGT